MLKIILSILVIVFIFGFAYYLKQFRKLSKEFAQFVKVTYLALKDGKLEKEEKENILKEMEDMKPILKNIKVKFVEDIKEISEIIDEVLGKAKTKIKRK